MGAQHFLLLTVIERTCGADTLVRGRCLRIRRLISRPNRFHQCAMQTPHATDENIGEIAEGRTGSAIARHPGRFV